MSLPKPNASFQIPSVHDDLELDCRIYYPRKTEQNAALFGRNFAIVAHPYAPLGGCYEDPVVALAGGTMLRHGCLLVTFNFRGASGSAGRTSWTGKPELADYVTVYGFMLCYIHAVGDAARKPDDRSSSSSEPTLILGGYSYGSMMASHLPAAETVAGLFASPRPSSTESEIKLRAEDLARDYRAYVNMHTVDVHLSPQRGRKLYPDDLRGGSMGVAVGGYESEAASRRISRENSRKSIDGERVRQSIDRVRRKLNHRVVSEPVPAPHAATSESPLSLPRLAYLLISPLLPPVAGFITMFSKLKFDRKDLVAGTGHLSASGEYDELLHRPCCIIYGSRDTFTTDRKLQKWTGELHAKAGDRVTVSRIDEGHFWHGSNSIVAMKQTIVDWVENLPRHAEAQKSKSESGAP